MGQTLTHGIYLPDEGERNCYSGLAANWQLLDGAVGTVAEHTTQIAGKAPLVHTHTKADITDFPVYGTTAGTICEGNDSRLSDARTPVAHTHGKADITDLLNSNFIPSANNSYDLGSSSYQWNNLYAKNYYYNGVAWGLDKENVWGDSNRFTKSINLGSITSYTDCTLGFTGLYNNLFFNTRGSSNITSYGTYVYYGYSNASSDRGGVIRMVRTTDKRGDANDGYIPDLSFNLYKISPAKLFIDFMEAVRVTNDGNENSLKPITNNATDLGTSTNKWKTLNGVNPGALSLPDTSRMTTVEIPSSWVWDGTTENSYTAPFTGWIGIGSSVATNVRLFNNNSNIGMTQSNAAGIDMRAYIPMVAGDEIKISGITSSSFILRVYQCLGNV